MRTYIKKPKHPIFFLSSEEKMLGRHTYGMLYFIRLTSYARRKMHAYPYGIRSLQPLFLSLWFPLPFMRKRSTHTFCIVVKHFIFMRKRSTQQKIKIKRKRVGFSKAPLSYCLEASCFFCRWYPSIRACLHNPLEPFRWAGLGTDRVLVTPKRCKGYKQSLL